MDLIQSVEEEDKVICKIEPKNPQQSETSTEFGQTETIEMIQNTVRDILISWNSNWSFVRICKFCRICKYCKICKFCTVCNNLQASVCPYYAHLISSHLVHRNRKCDDKRRLFFFYYYAKYRRVQCVRNHLIRTWKIHFYRSRTKWHHTSILSTLCQRFTTKATLCTLQICLQSDA